MWRSSTFIWIGFIAYLIFIGSYKFLFTEFVVLDFKTNIYLAPQLLLSDQWHTLYHLSHDVLLAPYRYSPLAAFFTLPFSLVFNLKIATFIWYVLTAGALIGQMALSLKICKLEKRSHLIIAVSIFFFFMYKLFLSEYKLGQVNIMVGFLTLASFWFYLQKKDALSGVFIFLAIIFKVMPFIFLFFYFFQKRWKILYACVISFLISVVPFSFVVSLDKSVKLFVSWIVALTHVPLSEYVMHTNQSVLSFLIYYLNTNIHALN